MTVTEKRLTRTGGRCGPWVELQRPKPTPVADRYAYWSSPPPELSDRCLYWVRQIDAGWHPNRRLRQEGYDASAEWYGVHIWEYLYVLCPLMDDAQSGGKAR